MRKQAFYPGQRVRIFRAHPLAGRLEATGTIIGYYRCGAWWVALDPHQCETVFDAHEIHPLEEGDDNAA